MDNLAQEAIQAALKCEWEEALEINKRIIKNNPKDLDALNRLAKAFIETGDVVKARKTAQKVLGVDPTNNIAINSLEKWKKLTKKDSSKSNKKHGLEFFIEEPGKTKIVDLIHLGSEKNIGEVDTGDEVKIALGKHRVSVLSEAGSYLGRLPDDISSRIIKLSKAGNVYRAFAKSICPREVKIFIREVERSQRVKDIPSFSTEKINYISFTPPELVHKKEDYVIQIADEE